MKLREFFTEADLLALPNGEIFVYDTEIFSNYWLTAFKHFSTGKIVYFESKNAERVQGEWLQWMLDRHCLVGFNNHNFDNILITLAISGRASISLLKEETSEIIERNARPQEILKKYGLRPYPCNSIDLIDVAPLTGSLKTYAARLHCEHLQDLPFNPNETLTLENIATTRQYCFLDLDNTELLLRELSPHLELRAALSFEFDKDLRSKSDSQIAQEIINLEIAKVTGKELKRIDFTKQIGKTFAYIAPNYIRFVSEKFNAILSQICAAEIEIGANGHVICPQIIKSQFFVIGEKRYVIGMGGLHSTEQCRTVVSGNCRILDRDVTGYYPNLLLKNKFSPKHLGESFLIALQNIVDKRYAAKKSGDAVTADSLKIASNGTFGKTSDPFSTLYSPEIMVQTTLTGQLSLLMIIEQLTLQGFEVISANTDGVVTLVLHEQYNKFVTIWKEWEKITNLETEETEYKALYARDVNNYIAVKIDGKTKAKGVYSEFGSALNSPLSKNPQAAICVNSVIAYLTKNVAIEETISNCKDIRKFIIVQNVTGGAQKNGKYLGKTVRWYYSTNTLGFISYCKNGNKVSMSDGGKPAMVLPSNFPLDIDIAQYVKMAREILEDIGAIKRQNTQLTFI